MVHLPCQIIGKCSLNFALDFCAELLIQISFYLLVALCSGFMSLVLLKLLEKTMAMAIIIQISGFII